MRRALHLANIGYICSLTKNRIMNSQECLTSSVNLVLENKEMRFSKLIQFWTFFCICSKTHHALHSLDFMFVNIAGVKNVKRKCSFHFLFTLLK